MLTIPTDDYSLRPGTSHSTKTLGTHHDWRVPRPGDTGTEDPSSGFDPRIVHPTSTPTDKDSEEKLVPESLWGLPRTRTSLPFPPERSDARTEVEPHVHTHSHRDTYVNPGKQNKWSITPTNNSRSFFSPFLQCITKGHEPVSELEKEKKLTLFTVLQPFKARI